MFCIWTTSPTFIVNTIPSSDVTLHNNNNKKERNKVTKVTVVVRLINFSLNYFFLNNR